MSNSRLAAILALDVVGYSRMMQVYGHELVSTLNTIFKKVVQPVTEETGGRIVKLLGDGAIVEFSGAASALRCAVEIQRLLRSADPPYSFPEQIRIRAGLHAGDVVVEGDDVFGDGVNIAARLEAAAQPGGILLSRTFRDLLGSGVPIKLLGEGLRSFKGIENPIEVFSVDFTDTEVVKRRQSLLSEQEVRFCLTKDKVSLAWTKNGEGPPIVQAPAWVSHLELDWRLPARAPFLTAIAAYRTLVRFDARGCGLSDRNATEMSFDTLVNDFASIFDVAGVQRAPILAMSQGCPLSVAYAVRHPERVSGIVMIGGFAQGRSKRSSKRERELAVAMRGMMTAGWDDDYPSLRDLLAQMFVPTASEEQRRQFATDMAEMITADVMARYREALDGLDIVDLLPQVEAPCLVIHCQGDRVNPIEQGRLLASGLRNSRFRTYDSPNHVPPENDPVMPLMLRDINEFLAGVD